MNGDPANSRGSAQRPPSMGFPSFLIAGSGGHALAMAISLGIAGVILGIPLRRLLVPFLVLAYCGVVLATSLYLARVARARWPKSFPLISGLGWFTYSGFFLLAVGFSAIRLHLVTLQEAVNEFTGIALLFLTVAFSGGYLIARQIMRPKQTE